MTTPNNTFFPLLDVEAVNVSAVPRNGPNGSGQGQGSPYVPILVDITAKSTGSTLNVGTAHALQYSLNNGSTWTDIVGWTSGSVVNTTLSLTLAVGNYPLWVRAKDQLGTISAIAKTNVTSNGSIFSFRLNGVLLFTVPWGTNPAAFGTKDGDAQLASVEWAPPSYQIAYFFSRYPSGTVIGPPSSIVGITDSTGYLQWSGTTAWGGDTSGTVQNDAFPYPPGWTGSGIDFSNLNIYNNGIVS